MTMGGGDRGLADLEAALVAEYRELTPRSAEQWKQLAELTPASFLSAPGLAPYPIFTERADGAHLYDVDGRELVDFFAAHSGGILGHNNPAIKRAISDELEQGLIFGLVRSTREYEVAAMLAERIPSVQKVRFSPTGSEAVMRALRAARAFTGRELIAKTDAGYHGNHDLVWYGPAIAHVQHPGTRELAPGISRSVADEVVLLPFNDIAGSTALVEQQADRLAAILVEPILGMSHLPADVEYLQALRALADRHGIVLVFDEMICLAVARGGAQELFGVTPDLTTAGKTVAHGMPLSFYGGRADIMDVTGRDAHRAPPQVIHGGTYQRHNVSLAAAAAALRQQDEALFQRLQATGAQLRDALAATVAAGGWPVQVTGVSHLWDFHWTGVPLHDTRSLGHIDHRIKAAIQLSLLNQGIYGIGVVTDAHRETHVRQLCAAFASSVTRVSAALAR